MPNSLIHSTSPYLLQHAHNPVDWVPWTETILAQAEQQNKLILFSVGYSACHWCHVMEHESFENEAVAELMNAHFICVKIDREEHPDMDAKLMTAVQLMTKQGGWPLNCITLPNGVPVYGGTYFPKEKWMHVLNTIANLYEEDKGKLLEYGDKLQEAVQQADGLDWKEGGDLPKGLMHEAVERWMAHLDMEWGGNSHAPKFPMPFSQLFLWQYANHYDHDKLKEYVHTTLAKMGVGGIFDQLGGGFARYSVDALWKVPHFEKMLYDNAQLLGVYAQAFADTGNAFYRYVATEIVAFVQEELLTEDNSFMCALDADSNGVEGEYYVWTEEELKQILNEQEWQLAQEAFAINDHGYWEEDNYILMLQQPKAIEREGFLDLKEKLKEARSVRVKPGLDNKLLTSWNALMISNLAKSAGLLNQPDYVALAEKSMQSLLKKASDESGGLTHTLNNEANKIEGYLEDYAFTIEALIQLYQATFLEKYLFRAKELLEYVESNFSDKKQTMFLFAQSAAIPALGNRVDIQDNVLPSTNAVMAHNLIAMSAYFHEDKWHARAEKMVFQMYEEVMRAPSAYACWANAYLQLTEPFYEVIVVGVDAVEKIKLLQQENSAPALYGASLGESRLPCFANKLGGEKAMVYVCKRQACQAPTEDVQTALLQMNLIG